MVRTFLCKQFKKDIQKRNYFTNTISKFFSNSLNPWQVTGFSDAESSFTITFVKNKALKTGYFIQPSFQINLAKNDLALLEKIKSFFKEVGTITNSGLNSTMYRVRSLNELNNIILPHFNEYPLKTQKQADYNLFLLIVDLLNKKEHLTLEGIRKILSIKASMNNGLNETIKADFPNIIPVLRDNIESKDLNPHWINGFIEGEGSFWIGIIKKNNTTSRLTPNLVFQITQHERDINLIKSFIEYFGCGRIKKEKPIVNFIVSNFSDIENKIVPFFTNYPLQGAKALNLIDFLKTVDIIKTKRHLTKDGMEEILDIKARMNRKRK
jgi:hypothetical protein